MPSGFPKKGLNSGWFKKGIGFWTGKKRSPEDIEKFRKSHLGKKPSIVTRLKMRDSHKRRVLDGKHNNYKGGITPVNAKIRNSFEMKLWREAVFKRDNWTCIWCGARSGIGRAIILHADHIKPFSLFPELRFAIDNGRTLCKECHLKTSTFAGKCKSTTFEIE